MGQAALDGSVLESLLEKRKIATLEELKDLSVRSSVRAGIVSFDRSRARFALSSACPCSFAQQDAVEDDQW